MIDTPAIVVKQFLINEALVSDPDAVMDWPIFLQHIVDVDREDVCAIYDIDPLKDGRIMRTGEVCLHYALQVKVRSKEYQVGWLKDDELQKSLCAVHNEDLTIELREWRLHNLTKTSAGFVGIDTVRRNIFVANYLLAMTRLN